LSSDLLIGHQGTLFCCIVVPDAFWESVIFDSVNPAPEVVYLDMFVARMEVDAEVSPSLQWYYGIAEIPTPDTIKYELCITVSSLSNALNCSTTASSTSASDCSLIIILERDGR